MQINWKVRIANKDFWLTLIPAVLLLIQAVAAPLGFVLDFGLPGVWMSFPFGLTSAGVMFYLRFRHTLKKKE